MGELMSQRRLIHNETHGADAEVLAWIERTPDALPRIQAWCGKMTGTGRLAHNGVRPTCCQCSLIWGRMQGKPPAAVELGNPQALSPAGDLMSLQDCAAILMSKRCPGCKGGKIQKMVFCRACYSRLPKPLQASLYRRYGHGFEAAYHEAIRILKPERPAA